MNTMVKIKASDGSGTFSAYVALPKRVTAAPAVLVIQEIFGVNAVMRRICDNLAAAGFLAICPDLFWRQQPDVQLTDQSEAEWAKAFQLFKGFDVDKGVDDLKATLSFIRQDKKCNGKAGTLGYCLGGKLAYLMATRSTADCNVAYYGVGIEELTGEVSHISRPLLMHIAEKDKFVPPQAQQKILGSVRVNKLVQAHVYHDVDHAFARIGGQHYNKAAADLANSRTTDFLAAQLMTIT